MESQALESGAVERRVEAAPQRVAVHGLPHMGHEDAVVVVGPVQLDEVELRVRRHGTAVPMPMPREREHARPIEPAALMGPASRRFYGEAA